MDDSTACALQSKGVVSPKTDGESYLHKAAKDVMTGWLEQGTIPPLPHFNQQTWQEYPLVNTNPFHTAWNETGWQFQMYEGDYPPYVKLVQMHGSIEYARALSEVGGKTYKHLTGSVDAWRRPITELAFHDSLPSNSAFWLDYENGLSAYLPDRPPTYAECLAMGKVPLLILDIALQHKGHIIAGIEIVHRHPVSPSKAALLEDLQIPVFEVSAGWVLGQIKRPCDLAIEAFHGRASHA